MLSYQIKKRHTPYLGDIYQMSCLQDNELVSQASLAPDFGFNLFSWQWRGVPIFYCPEKELSQTGFGGVPVLYPAPNRTKNGKFRFEDRDYQLVKNGVVREIHGLVYDEPWQLDECCQEACSVSGYIDFKPGTQLYQTFPFAHRLRVTYTLKENSLLMRFEVESQSDKNFPLGLGIHTYFCKSDPRITISVPADQRFLSDADRFPQKVILVEGDYDLRSPVPVSRLALDDVYTGLGEKSCVIDYPSTGRRLSIYGSKVFQNAVVFTPKDAPFFCYENQTCMTNAFHGEETGLLAQSGLVILKPGETCSGEVRFCLEERLS